MNGGISKGGPDVRSRRNSFRENGSADSSGFEKQGSHESSESDDDYVDRNAEKTDQDGTPDDVSSVASDTDGSEDLDESAQSTEDGSGEEIDALTFVKQYAALTKAAKRLGTDLDLAEDFEGGSIMVIDNVEDGEKLASRIGYDPSKAITAFTHTLAITETANMNVKKCGNTSSLFSIDKYLDILINLSVDEAGEYSVKKAHELLGQDARCCSEGYSLTTLQGSIEFSKDISVAVKPRKQITKLSKMSFDETVPPTQHEIVNSQVLKRQAGTENDSISKSRRQAEELQQLCRKHRKPAIGIFDYGRRGVHSSQNFIKQVFDAAVITRDGYAALCVPAALNLKIDEESELPGQQLLLQAAKPPDITEGDFDVNRSQYILRMNAKSIQALLKSANPGVAI